VKCVSYLFDGSKCPQKGIPLSKGATRSITEGGAKFLGKLVGISLIASKRTYCMIAQTHNYYTVSY